MKWAIALALSALVIGLPCAGAVAKTKSKAHSKTTASGQATQPTSAAKGKAVRSSARMASARSGKSRSRRYARRAPAPSYQAHPDPQRYQQIQQALADRGYFKGEVNGQWNDDSVSALKQFQADQKLEPDGKINSLSLIGLGLGPKHDGSSIAASSPQPAEPPPAPAEEPPNE